MLIGEGKIRGKAFFNCHVDQTPYLFQGTVLEPSTNKTRLVPHVIANFRIISQLASEDLAEGLGKVPVECLVDFGSFFKSLSFWSYAEEINRWLYRLLLDECGEEHPAVIRSMSDLANTLRCQGMLDEAASIQKEVLEKRKRIHGEAHPNTVTTMGNLASDPHYLDAGPGLGV